MLSAGIPEIKQELSNLSSKQITDLCLRLARYKKENKELLSYLLFEAHDPDGFVTKVKDEMDEEFSELPKSNWYFTKKSLRKILRSITKYSRHTGTKESAIEMLIHFCTKTKGMEIFFKKNQAFENLYAQQIKKINSLLKDIHEDLVFDYRRQLEDL